MHTYIHTDRTCRTMKQLSPSYWDAPRGRVTLAIHYIDKGDELARTDVSLFQEALVAVNKVERKLLTQFRGYECEPDSSFFMASFAEPLNAVRWCLQTQEDLLEIAWSAEMLSHTNCETVRDESGQRMLFNGARVQMGICTMDVTEAQVKPDLSTGAARYFGQICNHCSRVAAAAFGGEILIAGQELYDTLVVSQHQVRSLVYFPSTLLIAASFEVTKVYAEASWVVPIKGNYGAPRIG